jgi:hypothetical protein
MRVRINIIGQSGGEVMNKLSTLAANGGAEHTVVVIGIDLAKNVFALHGVNAAGKTSSTEAVQLTAGLGIVLAPNKTDKRLKFLSNQIYALIKIDIRRINRNDWPWPRAAEIKR